MNEGKIKLLLEGRRIELKIFILLCLPLFILIFTSCGSNKVYMSNEIQPSTDVSVSDIELYPGDEIEIKFAYTPEFNETQLIRSDGKIVLLLVGEVFVEGKTPSIIRDELTNLYSKYLSHSELAVIVRTSYRNRVYVGGAVNKPGVIDLIGKKTILDAIIETGGFELDSANLGDVLLIRINGGKRYVQEVNIKSYLSGDQPDFIYLKAMDIIFVPRTKITNMANYLDKIWSIIPFRFSATYVFDREDIQAIFD